MLFKDIIRKKRDGGVLSAEEISIFTTGLSDKSIPPEQISAMAMAIYFQSMTAEETGALTMAMAGSGDIIDWSTENLPGPAVDKHSTGGVGDKVSFILAPILAACGCCVPMISGRGLGHSGGTLDKIESVPGYCAVPDLATFRKTVKEIGCAIIGQTENLAPADRTLYAIRDVTGTVESIPLITASILSKKIAAGNSALIMDLKTGSGAFMQTQDEAKALARSIIDTAAHAGLNTRALITDMNETLGTSAGNAVEIAEIVAFLKNETREARLDEVTKALCVEVLLMASVETDAEAAMTRVETAITSGAAAEKFAAMLTSLGGPADFMQRSEHYLSSAEMTAEVLADEEGYLSAVNARKVGEAIIELGGGRKTQDDRLDLSVGFTEIAPIGARVDKTRPLAIIHAASHETCDQAATILKQACEISDTPPPQRLVIYDTLS